MQVDALFAAPQDDGPRLVLADALQELGDPRGEFISLQLNPRRSQRSERRMQKLLERHRGAFLGPLEAGHVTELKRALKRLGLRNMSLAVSTHSRMK